MIKARRISALLLAAALLLGCIPQALAVGEQIHSYEPIRTGDPRIDSLADELLKQIPTDGKTDAQKFRPSMTGSSGTASATVGTERRGSTKRRYPPQRMRWRATRTIRRRSCARSSRLNARPATCPVCISTITIPMPILPPLPMR